MFSSLASHSIATMASTQTRPIRLLGELLQEEQEPFILEVYLWERGYVKTKSISEPSKVSRSEKGTSKLLKSMYKKLLLINKTLSINNCDDKVGEEVVSDPEMTSNYKSVMSSDKLSSACTTSAYNSTHRRPPQDMGKSQKQSQLVPGVLRVTEESASLWELLTGFEERCKAKTTLQQNKQLLFDCVREMIEKHGRECCGEVLMGKIREWGRRSSIEQLLDMDFVESMEEWDGFKRQKRELAVAIGDGILEELVMDMLEPPCFSI